MGVNRENPYLPEQHNIISNASCTTNCLAPVAKVLHDNFFIEKGLMTTIHSYTNDQRILDLPHSTLGARGAQCLNDSNYNRSRQSCSPGPPRNLGRLDGMAIRVPTPNVSLIDLVVEVKKNTSNKEVNGVFKEAARKRVEKHS
ncbi:MAG: hypothetical protein Ct9H300mP23_04080 [Nitrospinota bacterium]|nr:MAG: hypothetical protein Ct9H300mP23_04080 [Nitrospinota bacterium]